MARRQLPPMRPPRPEVLAFLQDSKDHPEDDTPRLILADWLEDHDDEPRAEFLRVQLQLARPGNHSQRRALQERERQLIAQYASGWLAPLDQQTATWSFQRGLARLALVGRDGTASDLLDLVGTEAYAWVDSLAFHGLRAEDVTLLVQSRAQPGSPVTNGTEPGLLGGLTGFHLPHGNRIVGEPLAALAASPSLRRLVTLDLSWAILGDAGAAVLGSSPFLGRLTTLLLPGNALTNAGVRALTSSHLARLATLNLAHNPIGVEGARALAETPFLTRLVNLDLHQCGIGDAGLVMLAASPVLGRLGVVDLDSNDIGDEGVVALASSPSLSRLTTIDLRGNRIGSRGAHALAASPYLEHLECLQLYRNRLKDADVLLLRERFGRKLWL